MQFNVLQLYLKLFPKYNSSLNGLVIFSYFLNYQLFYMSWIIHFEIIETIIQMLHIALINIYWNTHNNLMSHIYIWTC
jgi:hypothetical protein